MIELFHENFAHRSYFTWLSQGTLSKLTFLCSGNQVGNVGRNFNLVNLKLGTG